MATCIFVVTLSVMKTTDAICYDSADCGSSSCCTLGMAICLLKKITYLRDRHEVREFFSGKYSNLRPRG
jgi:hypothetical protein